MVYSMDGKELQHEPDPARGPTFREALLLGYLQHLRQGSRVVADLLATLEGGQNLEPTSGGQRWQVWQGVLEYAAQRREWSWYSQTLDLSAVVDCLEVCSCVTC